MSAARVERQEETAVPVNRLVDLLYGGPFALKSYPKGILGEKRMPVAKFAAAIGVSRQMVYFYLDGRSNPSEEVADKMAAELGISRRTLDRFCSPVDKG